MSTPPDDGLIRVDEQGHRAWKGAVEVPLSRLAFGLLAVLARHPGELITHRRLIREVWHTDWMGVSKTLSMHMSILRHKLGDDARHPRYISTVRGLGYRLEAHVVAPPGGQAAEPVVVATRYRSPLGVRGQVIHDADGVMVALAMSPQSAAWIVEAANAALDGAGVVARG